MVADGFTNGTHREPHDEGALGEPMPGRRAALVILGKMVTAGELAAEALPGAVKFARAIIDSPESTHRDRLRAMEFLARLGGDGCSAAVDGDKIERLDSGGASDRVEVVFTGKVPRAMNYAKD